MPTKKLYYWSGEQTQALLSAVPLFTDARGVVAWAQVARCIRPRRTANKCRLRYFHLMSERPAPEGPTGRIQKCSKCGMPRRRHICIVSEPPQDAADEVQPALGTVADEECDELLQPALTSLLDSPEANRAVTRFLENF